MHSKRPHRSGLECATTGSGGSFPPAEMPQCRQCNRPPMSRPTNSYSGRGQISREKCGRVSEYKPSEQANAEDRLRYISEKFRCMLTVAGCGLFHALSRNALFLAIRVIVT